MAARHLPSYNSPPVHADHLGSTRLVTDLNKNIVQNLDYLPFGEINSTDSGISTHKFTGDERDWETNLDHTWFRQYSSQFARWTSLDPAGLAAVDPSNPQSWNRYAYVTDDPVDYVDPFGLFLCASACSPPPDPTGPTDPTNPSGSSGSVGPKGDYPNRRGGKGSTIGPAPQPKPPKVCKLIDVLRASVDSGFGIGLGLKAGLFSADISWWRSLVDNSTNADYSLKLLTVGAEGSSKDPTGQWNPDTTTSLNEIKYGPYRYNTDSSTWRRANTTLSKDLFKTQYGITALFYKVQIDIGKANEYITKNGCDVIEL